MHKTHACVPIPPEHAARPSGVGGRRQTGRSPAGSGENSGAGRSCWWRSVESICELSFPHGFVSVSSSCSVRDHRFVGSSARRPL